MKIYRVERINPKHPFATSNFGSGLYRSDTACVYLNDKNRHPVPQLDEALGWYEIPGKERDMYYFGFASIEQLKFWIYQKECRELLHEEGFKISVYEGNIKHGDTQAVIHIKGKTLVETLNLTEI